MTLADILDGASSAQCFVLIQSSIAQSGLPIFRHILAETLSSRKPRRTLLISFLYPPSILLDGRETSDALRICNRLGKVPGFDFTAVTHISDVLGFVDQNATDGPMDIVIDSLDTLASDLESTSQTYKLLSKLLKLVTSRAASNPARLIVHCQSSETPPDILRLLTDVSFSSSLVHLIARPPVLLRHIATEYLTVPPSDPEEDEAGFTKYLGVYLPISERETEIEQLVFGPEGDGAGDPNEFVVEALARGLSSSKNGRRNPLERVLEGWNIEKDKPCRLNQMQSLRGIWKTQVNGGTSSEPAADPTRNLTFNLNLTPSQQQSRAEVPLPYVHAGQSSSTPQQPGAIYYDPDSADDLDDDDPDEDLDI